MYPHERSLVNKLAGKPFALIGVNSDRDREALKDTLKEKGITWRSFWNGPEGTGGPISKKWNVRGWPTIYVLDAEGKIRYKNVRGDDLDRALEKLMAEAGHEVDLSEHEDPLEAKKKEDEDSEDDDSEEKKESASEKKDDKGE
jgi:hypothetical protein